MKAIVTGSCGLVGFSAVRRLLADGWSVLGIDNDRRKEFFGEDGSTAGLAVELSAHPCYEHYQEDIRSPRVTGLFDTRVDLVIHCAAQPSHDWAASNVGEDFGINALGTLNLLEACRRRCQKAVFIHVSTSKVYGDNPNRLPLVEKETRWELPEDHELWSGIPEMFPVDHCLHSFFGVSKLSGDLLAQEYGRNLGMAVGVFRPGCVTGGRHRGVEQHGFLSYLTSCVVSGKPYRVYGYGGKQVRCNVHADDLVEAFIRFAADPKPGEVYNIGGRRLECSLKEAISWLESRCGRPAKLEYVESARRGDHVWWVSDAAKLRRDYGWEPRRVLPSVLEELYDSALGKK